LRFAILTVTSVLALAYVVMNLSGQAATIGHFVAAAGAGLANALFGALQVTAARESLQPTLPAASSAR
jgi:lactate permease